MECLSPLTFKKNGLIQTVPCGKCLSCLSRRRSSWSFRLNQEMRVSTSAHFLTLTYSDENLPRSPTGFPVVVKRDVQLWLKRFRKLLSPFKVRYFAVSEYGTQTFRPHYHVILFNFPNHLDINVLLEKSWTHGFFSYW